MNHPRNERGAAAVEFALVLPLLMLVLCATIDFGARYQYASKLNNAAAVAARDMSITNDAAHAKTAGVNAGAPATGAGTTWAIGTCVTDGNTTVTITTQRATATKFFGTTFNVTGKAVARCQL
jgi:Flp pilus assembly protein TadG